MCKNAVCGWKTSGHAFCAIASSSSDSLQLGTLLLALPPASPRSDDPRADSPSDARAAVQRGRLLGEPLGLAVVSSSAASAAARDALVASAKGAVSWFVCSTNWFFPLTEEASHTVKDKTKVCALVQDIHHVAWGLLNSQ